MDYDECGPGIHVPLRMICITTANFVYTSSIFHFSLVNDEITVDIKTAISYRYKPTFAHDLFLQNQVSKQNGHTDISSAPEGFYLYRILGRPHIA